MEVFVKTDLVLWNPMRTAGRFLYGVIGAVYGQPDNILHNHQFYESAIKECRKVVVSVRNPYTRYCSYERWRRLFDGPQPEMEPICYDDKIRNFKFYDVIRYENLYTDLERVFKISYFGPNYYKTEGESYDDLNFLTSRPDLIQYISDKYSDDFEKFGYSKEIAHMYDVPPLIG